MGEIDLLLDKAARTLDELRFEYKSKGIQACGNKLEAFDEAQEQLLERFNHAYEHQ